jgi:hypothetical protein
VQCTYLAYSEQVKQLKDFKLPERRLDLSVPDTVRSKFGRIQIKPGV